MESITAAIIASCSSLAGVIIGLFSNHFKEKHQIRQQKYQTKRENLTEIYKKLIGIVNLFPNKSPNDIMQRIKDSPSYSLEGFDAALNSIECMIEDKQNQLGLPNLDYSRKNNLETDLSNLEYAQKEIIKNKDQYFLAKERYEKFKENDKIIFDLYADQEVRNKLVHFEVIIHNVFISGMIFEDANIVDSNILENERRNLIYVMRKDIGIE